MSLFTEAIICYFAQEEIKTNHLPAFDDSFESTTSLNWISYPDEVRSIPTTAKVM
jgi:hypothetical protein